MDAKNDADGRRAGATEIVPVGESILSANDRQAARNRQQFREAGVLALNVMGSPGSGKTALLEATARALAGRRRIAALAGDLATDNDRDRLLAAGIRAASINTVSGCHLDASMVDRALRELRWADREYFFIENVGNLVCPAVYDLGQAANVVLLSVTEGDDKPLKYPVMFRKADLVVVTKIDLLPHLEDVSVDRIRDAVARVMPAPRVFEVSARTGRGLDRWIEWLAEMERAASPRAGAAPGIVRAP